MPSHTYTDAMIKAINSKLPIMPGNRFGFTPLEINKNCGHGLVDPQPPHTPLNYDLYKDFSREYNFEYQNFDEWQQTLIPPASAGSSSSTKSELEMSSAAPAPPYSSSSAPEQLRYNHELMLKIVAGPISKTLPDYPEFKDQNYIENLAKFHIGILARAYHQQVGCSPIILLNKISTFFPHLTFKTEQQQTVKSLFYDTKEQTWILKVHSTVTFVTDPPDPNPFFHTITLTTFSHLGPFPNAIAPEMMATEINLQACIAKYMALFNDGFILKQIQIQASNPYLELFNKLLCWNSIEHPNFLEYLASPVTIYYAFKSPSSQPASLSAAEKLSKLIKEDTFECTFTIEEIIAMRDGQLKRYMELLRPAIYFKTPELFRALGYNFSNIPSFILLQEQFFGT